MDSQTCGWIARVPLAGAYHFLTGRNTSKKDYFPVDPDHTVPEDAV